MYKYLLAIIAIEALTQLVCKAEIFDTSRNKIMSWGWWTNDLLSCPYCVSVWSAAFVMCFLDLPSDVYLWPILWLVLHRTSNYLHDMYGIILNTKINLILSRRNDGG